MWIWTQQIWIIMLTSINASLHVLLNNQQFWGINDMW